MSEKDTPYCGKKSGEQFTVNINGVNTSHDERCRLAGCNSCGKFRSGNCKPRTAERSAATGYPGQSHAVILPQYS